jgi:hypothetical protein
MIVIARQAPQKSVKRKHEQEQAHKEAERSDHGGWPIDRV